MLESVAAGLLNKYLGTYVSNRNFPLDGSSLSSFHSLPTRTNQLFHFPLSLSLKWINRSTISIRVNLILEYGQEISSCGIYD